ncbi:MAG: DNA repair protein RecN [Flavobacteriaceae bacterium]|nr:DNA repair protein RecN [Flavobacteriaceae bacterium]
MYFVLKYYNLLKELNIKNYALIEDLSIKLDAGFICMTGETGSGKSILLGALSLLLGKRSDSSIFKDKNNKCVVEGIFKINLFGLKNLFEEYDLDYNNETVIRRELKYDGNSRSFINDTPVKLNILNIVVAELIDIHSQNHSIFLKKQFFQLNILDSISNNIELRNQFKVKFNSYYLLKNNLIKLENELKKNNSEKEYNTYLIEELNKIDFENFSLNKLTKELDYLNNLDHVKELISKSNKILNNDNFGLINQLNELYLSFSKLSQISDKFSDLKKRIESVNIELKDIDSEINYDNEGFNDNIKKIDELNNKIHFVNGLIKKHNVTNLSELESKKSEIQEKISNSNKILNKIEDLKKNKLLIKNDLNFLSEKLSKSRTKNKKLLENQFFNLFQKLGLKNAKLKIEVSENNEFNENGKNSVTFYFSANKGVDYKKLNKVASGGELSRIMLAIKIILSKYKSLPSIIFDEIGSGTSGDISMKIAKLMHVMSKKMQVITITHLPQIAAKGDFHYKVYKESDNETTSTKLKLLDKKSREIEIAEMLGGGKQSKTAIDHARQLLN